MRFRNKYSPITEAPKDGFYACLGLSVIEAAETFAAAEAGTGPGTPDAYGTLEAGTIKPGTLVMFDAAGHWVAATSPDVSSVLPVPIFLVHEGNDDFTGRYATRLVVVRGFARLVTEKVTGSSFAVGDALVASSGSFAKKTQGDHLQIVGWVGPNGYVVDNGVPTLDVILEAVAWG